MQLQDMTGEELIGYRDYLLEFMKKENPSDERIFNDVNKELFRRLEVGQKAKEAMNKIGDLVYNNSCHVDTSNEVTIIFMEYSTEK